jgi:hypothetical protein
MMKNEAIEAHNAVVNAKYEEMVANAINLCETTINDEFAKKAENREPLKVAYWVGTYKDELGHEFFRFGAHRTHLISSQLAYAVKPFIDYLHKFCFEVVISEADGSGDRKLTVYIPKEDSNRTCDV